MSNADQAGIAAIIDLYDLGERTDSAPLGLRERHKIDKLRRIATASKELFAELGYEATTLREIAKRADVALGTLSLYAEDKRDLIVMLFNQLIPPLMEQAAKAPKATDPLVDNMLAYYRSFYVAYTKDVTLYRLILGQIFNRPTSIHAPGTARIRVRIIATMMQIIGWARATGEIVPTGDLDLQARSFFYLYFATVRLWLADQNPTPTAGMADLRAMFELHVSGLRTPGRHAPLASSPGVDQPERGEPQTLHQNETSPS